MSNTEARQIADTEWAKDAAKAYSDPQGGAARNPDYRVNNKAAVNLGLAYLALEARCAALEQTIRENTEHLTCLLDKADGPTKDILNCRIAFNAKALTDGGHG